jgi:hypothetical protein
MMQRTMLYTATLIVTAITCPELWFQHLSPEEADHEIELIAGSPLSTFSL